MSLDPGYTSDVVHSFIKKSGEQGYLLKVTNNAVNPITGRSTSTTTKYLAWMSFGKINSKEMYGNDFNYNERRCYISAKDLAAHGVEPDHNDKVIVAGDTWTINWVHKYRVSAGNVLWMCKVEK